MARGETTSTRPAEPRDDLRTPRPTDAPSGRPAADVAGATPAGGSLGVAVCGVEHDTVLLFLSSDCATCQRFWTVLATGAPERPVLPDGVRLVVVTHGPDHESPAAIAAHDAEVPVVMSDRAWTDYEVPGSPYAVHVDGPSGRVRGEGTGGDWGQVAQLLARATGDLAYVGETAPRSRKARRDAVAEQDTDAALLAAGDPARGRQPVPPRRRVLGGPSGRRPVIALFGLVLAPLAALRASWSP